MEVVKPEAAPVEELLLAELVPDALATPEPVEVPVAVGVADDAGYAAPRALISKGCDWA